MEVRAATQADLHQILKVYQIAREFMRKNGNPHQWGKIHPPQSMLQTDIEKRQLFVIEHEKEIVGVFALLHGADPTYKYIEGKWCNDTPYVTIHRIASNGSVPGIFRVAVEFAKQQCRNIRIDTHHNNKVMQQLLQKYGFVRCGIIYLENGDPRIAYQLAL